MPDLYATLKQTWGGGEKVGIIVAYNIVKVSCTFFVL